MATYAGVTFDVLYERGDYADQMPEFEEQQVVVETPIYGAAANANDIQCLGFTNERLRVTAIIASAANLATLKAARGITLRTLNYRGSNVTNVMLLQVARRQFFEDGKIQAELEFCKGTP